MSTGDYPRPNASAYGLDVRSAGRRGRIRASLEDVEVQLLRKLIPVALTLVGLFFVTACVPLPQNPECRERISSRLRDCRGPAVPAGATPGGHTEWGATDTRTQCEKHCHSLCL